MNNPDFRAQQEAEHERYQMLTDAMNECVAKGVSCKALLTLTMECCFNSEDLINLLQKDVARIKAKLEAME